MENNSLHKFMVRRSIVLLLLIAVALIFFGLQFIEKELGKKNYISKEVPLSFSYSEDYLLDEKWQGSGERTWYQVTLVEDTQENRDLLSGKITEPREGPVAIIVSVFPNTLDGYTTERFVKETNYSNWKLSPDGLLEEIGVAGEEGLTYRFSGLYEGEAVIVARPEYVYMFSATYQNPNDQIHKDFKKLLGTIAFTGDSEEEPVKTLYNFKDFSNIESFSGTPVPVDFSSQEGAEMYRTVITNGAKLGPNFAGHYSVVTWGCGTSCGVSAIVDIKTGKIIVFGIPSSTGLGYSKESRLLVVNPLERVLAEQNLLPKDLGTDYYELKDGKLIYLNSEPKDGVCIQVLAQAKNPATGEVKTFPTPCQVPFGWVKTEEGTTDDTVISFSLNDVKTVNGIKFTLTDIEDSRCPANVNCVWAGEVKATLMAEKGTVKKTLVVRTNTEGEVFENYRIKITNATPGPGPAGTTPDKKTYKIEFSITKE